jgi:hypothetical protein
MRAWIDRICVYFIWDFARKARIVREALKTVTAAGGGPIAQEWKDKADETLGAVLGANEPDRTDLAHSYLEPRPDGSVILQRPGKEPQTWTAEKLKEKVANLSNLASEVAAITSQLHRMNIPVPTGWMSMDPYLPRQKSAHVLAALQTTAFSGVPKP